MALGQFSDWSMASVNYSLRMPNFISSAFLPTGRVDDLAKMARNILDPVEVISMLSTNNPTFMFVHQSLVTLICVNQAPSFWTSLAVQWKSHGLTLSSGLNPSSATVWHWQAFGPCESQFPCL